MPSNWPRVTAEQRAALHRTQVRAYRYLEDAAPDLLRINPGAAETAAEVVVRLRPYVETGETDE